jgi:predicted DCC family thiol-disulfide oxidoreductase YuxK
MIPQSPILLFDGVCNLCNSLVKFIIKKDPEGRIRFAPLQSSSGKMLLGKSGMSEDEINSVVYIADGKTYLRSSAILHLLKELGGGWRLFYGLIIIPPFIRDFFYDIIAKTRYRVFGRSDSCMIPTDELKNRFL